MNIHEGFLFIFPRVLTYIRATQPNQLPPCDGFQGRFWQFLRPIASKVVANKVRTVQYWLRFVRLALGYGVLYGAGGWPVYI